MSNQSKLTLCKTCNAQIAKSAKVCPACGARIKKPIYRRAWFVILVAALLFSAVGKLNSKNSNDKHTSPVNIQSETAFTISAPTLPSFIDPTQPTVISPTQSATEQMNSSPTEPTTELLVDGMRPEFKAAMDSYESFYDQYVDFMKKYSKNPSDLGLLMEYASMVQELDKMEKAFNAWDQNEMNSTELAYYLEVSVRISNKLLEIVS